MADRYLKSAGKSYSNEKENNQKKRHRCVAAIICHPYQREPFVAVLCTGTKHNYDKCYSTLGLKDSPPCDAHAESLCLEIAPIFLQNEMLNCSSDEKLSIFKYNSNDKKFALESNETKFHLLITEPPCGWIKDKQDPCMEWKPFTEVPHIPTCSARILISSKMGFQGYVSHLLYHPIFLESVIILYTKDHKPNYNFPKNTFDLKLPTISTLEYEPKIFNLAQEPPTFEQMNLGSTQIGAKKRKEHTIGTSAIVIGQGQSALEESYVMNSTYNVHKRLETNHNKSQEQRFAITNREVDSKLPKVDQQIKRERKKEIKRMYDNLIEKLNLIDVLQKQLEECTKYKTNKEMEIKRLLAKYNFADVVAKEVDNLMNKEYDSEQWLSTTRELQKNMEVLGTEGKRLIDVQNLIKDINKLIEDPLRCILDCSWKRYFDEP